MQFNIERKCAVHGIHMRWYKMNSHKNFRCCLCKVDYNQRKRMENKLNDPIRPNHYGGEENPFEPIKVIEAWGLNFNLGNTVKYISRAGKKDALLQELKKARWYLDREISNLEKKA